MIYNALGFTERFSIIEQTLFTASNFLGIYLK